MDLLAELKSRLGVFSWTPLSELAKLEKVREYVSPAVLSVLGEIDKPARSLTPDDLTSALNKLSGNLIVSAFSKGNSKTQPRPAIYSSSEYQALPDDHIFVTCSHCGAITTRSKKYCNVCGQHWS